MAEVESATAELQDLVTALTCQWNGQTHRVDPRDHRLDDYLAKRHTSREMSESVAAADITRHSTEQYSLIVTRYHYHYHIMDCGVW